MAYWVFTLAVVYENLSGFVWVATGFEYATAIVRHLGYPEYFLDILGAWQLAAALVLIAPGLPLMKEWAYTGAFLNYSSAVASHVLAGDGLNVYAAAALAYAVLVVGSWALRPTDRRITNLAGVGLARVSSWVGPAVALVLMTIASVVTLPLMASLVRLLPA
jgi:hypothetical protein